MTEYVWKQRSAASSIYWLRPQGDIFDSAIGLVHKLNALHGGDPDDWYVATWMPQEKQVAILSKDLPEDEALAMAKMLILLSLKQKENSND